MFALVTGFPLFAGLVKGSIYFLCLISVTPIMLLLSGRSHVRRLYTVLLALSGSCSFVFAFAGIEFIADCQSCLAMCGMLVHLHGLSVTDIHDKTTFITIQYIPCIELNGQVVVEEALL